MKYKSSVYGKGGIYAKVVEDSIANGIRLSTLETASPFNIDAEVEKHRAISKNSSSGRAIPISVTTQIVLDEPYFPMDVRLNQSGMQGFVKAEGEDLEAFLADVAKLRDNVVDFVLKHKHIHKQHLNDYLKPFLLQKKVWTATDFDHFFHLRLHPAAKPEMVELARCMKHALEESTPKELLPGEWHTPYALEGLIGEDACKSSVAGCARVSYDNLASTKRTLEGDVELFNQLVTRPYTDKRGNVLGEDDPRHESPREHQATPIDGCEDWFGVLDWQEGITHTDRYGNYWSGNLRGWIQYRQLL